MKEKLLYLVSKIKELLGLGTPITSIDLTGASKVSDFSGMEDEVVTGVKDDGKFIDPNRFGEDALKTQVDELEKAEEE